MIFDWTWSALTFAAVRSGDDVSELVSTDFRVPHKIVGLDAALSVLADLDWLAVDNGVVWLIDGMETVRVEAPALARDIVVVLINLCDRWRSRGRPFRIGIASGPFIHQLVTEQFTLKRSNQDRLPKWLTFEVPPLYERAGKGWVARTGLS